MSTQHIPLEKLRPHPANSNVMPEALVDKLANHIQRTGRYPPLIVRPYHATNNTPAEASPHTDVYQILDGHHRALALKEIGKSSAQCVIWQADDHEAMLLLATLNRLQGQDDPRKRAKLLDALASRHDLKELTNLLPERVEQIKKYLQFNDPPPAPRPPKPIGQMPVAVHFFLLPNQKARLDKALRRYEGTREDSLMNLLSSVESSHTISSNDQSPTTH